MIFKRKQIPTESYEIARILRMLDFVKETEKAIKTPSVQAVICNDCVVVMDIRDEGEDVRMSVIKDFRTIPFNLNFSPEQVEKFNGGSGLSMRKFTR